MKKLLLIVLLCLAVYFGLKYFKELTKSGQDFIQGTTAVKDNQGLTGAGRKNALSANPYDYIKNNPAYDRLVKQGPAILPYLRDKIANSPVNGLEEYLTALAAEQIAKVDLKSINFGWASAKEWVTAWDSYLRSVPARVKEITGSRENTATKNDQLIKLGIPAIPFIMDEVEKGKREVVPALDKLLQESGLVVYDQDWTKDIDQWIKANKAKFAGLRQMVNGGRR